MTYATDDDCKKFLQLHAAAHGWPFDGSWKRLEKIKTEQGWERLFEHGDGAKVRLIEPFGQGAAGLRVAGAAARNPGGASSPFDSAGPALKAAMLWVDAMLVLGGQPPAHAKAPGANDWSWRDFKRALDDFSGDERNEQAQSLVERWVEAGMADPAGAALMKSKVKWCYVRDADYMQIQSRWAPGDGSDVRVWAVDAPDLEPGYLLLPPLAMRHAIAMDGILTLGTSAATGRAAMALAWDELHADGFAFDLDGQRKYGEGSHCDEAHPLRDKVFSIIPALAARKEAQAIGACAPKPPGASSTKRSL